MEDVDFQLLGVQFTCVRELSFMSIANLDITTAIHPANVSCQHAFKGAREQLKCCRDWLRVAGGVATGGSV